MGWRRTGTTIIGRRRLPGIVFAIVTAMLLAVTALLFWGGSRAVRRLSDLPPPMSRSRGIQDFLQSRAKHGKCPCSGHGSEPGLSGYKLLVQFSSIRGTFFGPDFKPGEPYTVLSNTHNDYLQTLVEWGWIGLLGWILLVGNAFRPLWRACRSRTMEWPLAVTAAIALGGVFIHAFVDCPLEVPVLQLFTAVYLGLGLSFGWSHQTHPTSSAIPNNECISCC